MQMTLYSRSTRQSTCGLSAISLHRDSATQSYFCARNWGSPFLVFGSHRQDSGVHWQFWQRASCNCKRASTKLDASARLFPLTSLGNAASSANAATAMIHVQTDQQTRSVRNLGPIRVAANSCLTHFMNLAPFASDL